MWKAIRSLAIVAAVSATFSNSVFATPATSPSPLPAGKPAGTRDAALLALGPIFWIGLAVVAVTVGVAASNNGGNNNTTTTTGTGS